MQIKLALIFICVIIDTCKEVICFKSIIGISEIVTECIKASINVFIYK